MNAWELFWTKLVTMNEWLTIRRERRAIYTLRQNLIIEIYVESSDADLWTSDLYRKHYRKQGLGHYKHINIESSDDYREFQWSKLPTHVGSSDRWYYG